MTEKQEQLLEVAYEYYNDLAISHGYESLEMRSKQGVLNKIRGVYHFVAHILFDVDSVNVGKRVLRDHATTLHHSKICSNIIEFYEEKGRVNSNDTFYWKLINEAKIIFREEIESVQADTINFKKKMLSKVDITNFFPKKMTSLIEINKAIWDLEKLRIEILIDEPKNRKNFNRTDSKIIILDKLKNKVAEYPSLPILENYSGMSAKILKTYMDSDLLSPIGYIYRENKYLRLINLKQQEYAI